jgi:hypothetical protein
MDENCNVQAAWPPSRLMEEFFDFSLVAQGGYGIVFRAWNLNDRCQYAIKIIYHGYVTIKTRMRFFLSFLSNFISFTVWWKMR